MNRTVAALGRLLHQDGQFAELVLIPPAARALSQTQAVQDASDVIRIVAHAEGAENRAGETHRGPPVVGIPGGSRAGLVDLSGELELLRL